MVNNFIKSKKHIIMYVGAVGVVTGGIILCANSCNGKQATVEKNDDTKENTQPSVTTTVAESTKKFTTTTPKEEINEITLEDLGFEEPEMSSSTEYTEVVEAAPSNDDEEKFETTIELKDSYKELLVSKDAKEVFTTHDIMERSIKLVDYVNDNAVLVHDNYKRDAITVDDMIMVVTLANIDHIDNQVLSELISNGLIDENFKVNLLKSFNFFELYTYDTINKVNEGKKNILDLGLLMAYSEDRENARIMNNIITGFSTNDSAVNKANYRDVVYYFQEGVVLPNDYSYKNSILVKNPKTAGSQFAESFQGTIIEALAENYGVANKTESEILLNGATDYANLMNVFYQQCMEQPYSFSSNQQYVK